MSSSTRIFAITNVVLVSLIGAMIWILSTEGQTDLVSLPSPAPSKPAFSTEGLSEKDTQAIESLQTQLEEEKKHVEKTWEKLIARTQKSTTNNAQQITAELGVEQQEQRVTQTIEAQPEGVEEENKNQEIAIVKNQKSALSMKLTKLDDSAQALLNKLVADGNSVSSSDQDYLGAMQALQNDAVNPQGSANLAQTDLINRIEIADNGDTESIAAQLRSAVDNLMENKNKEKPATSSSNITSPAAGQSADIEKKVNNLLARNEEQKAQRQFQADLEYLDSLAPLEKERQNETRWVTVRQGDTLSDIAERVYSNGRLYHKLFEANPQVLNHPDLIKSGQRLRVPL